MGSEHARGIRAAVQQNLDRERVLPAYGHVKRRVVIDATLIRVRTERHTQPKNPVDLRTRRRSPTVVLYRLSPASRAVLLLHDQRPLSLEEAAAILDIPLGSAKSRLAYGLADAHETRSKTVAPNVRNDYCVTVE